MATHERSAGILVYRADTEGSDRRFLLLDYGKHWDFPKGHLNRGETDSDAAIRELTEETGITRFELVLGFARSIVYFFRHPKRGLVRKEVIYFLASTRTRKITLSHEHVGFAFLPYPEALERVTYANSKQVLRDAQAYLENSSSSPVNLS